MKKLIEAKIILSIDKKQFALTEEQAKQLRDELLELFPATAVYPQVYPWKWWSDTETGDVKTQKITVYSDNTNSSVFYQSNSTGTVN